MWLDEALQFIKVSGTFNAIDHDISARSNDICGGKSGIGAVHFIGGQDGMLSGGLRHRILEVEVRLQFFNFAFTGAHSDTEHDDFIVGDGELIELGQFLNAGRTPGSPEVEDDRLAALLMEYKRLPIHCLDTEIRCPMVIVYGP